MVLQVVNPATGETVTDFDEMDGQTVRHRIRQADDAFRQWRRTDIAERATLFREASVILESEKANFASLMALEMGKPIRDGRAEIDKCAWVCRHFAEKAPEMLANEVVPASAGKNYVTFQPLGVVLAIMPWNYPFWQVFRFAAPALMAGNAALLKHASNVPGCALAIETVFHKAGFPGPLFQTLLISSEKVPRVIEDPLVSAVTLTGSNRAGRAVAAIAGRHLKKTVLELGGSDPYLILEDADMDLAVAACASSRLLNSGQSCIAAKRFIVVEAVRKEFEERLVRKMRQVRMGDPFDEKTEIGPLARSDLRDALHDQVKRSIEQGARCLLGGKIPVMQGFYYPPTVLTDVRKGMPVFDEETFGPVSTIISAANDAAAVKLANDTDFGLGAAVFTRDIAHAERIAAEELDAGNCFVNAFVKSDPRLPFGGIKASGYGRELSHYGIKEFVNIKTVHLG